MEHGENSVAANFNDDVILVLVNRESVIGERDSDVGEEEERGFDIFKSSIFFIVKFIIKRFSSLISSIWRTCFARIWFSFRFSRDAFLIILE